MIDILVIDFDLMFNFVFIDFLNCKSFLIFILIFVGYFIFVIKVLEKELLKKGFLIFVFSVFFVIVLIVVR